MLRISILICLLQPAIAVAQIRVVTYNIRHQEDSASLPIVLSAIGEESVQGIQRPVDILLLQETRSAAKDAKVIAGILNGDDTDVYAYGTGEQDVRGSMYQSVVYRSDVLGLVSTEPIGKVAAPGEGQPRQAMRYEFEWVGLDRRFYVYNSHYRASRQGEDDRLIEAEAIRDDADLLGDVPIIYAGDFNFYSANDRAYQHLLNWEGDSQAVDPLSGDWSLAAHTHATSMMDGRFDFQLVTEELLDGRGMDLVSGSYRAFGNDGSHTPGKSITSGTWAPPGVSDPAGVLAALSLDIDHLPVVADYTPAPIGDSNLDDVFDSSDLVTVFQAGQYEDNLADNSNWITGDWNGDRDFDSGDLVYAFQRGSYEAAAQPVPEPRSLVLSCLAVAVWAFRHVRL